MALLLCFMSFVLSVAFAADCSVSGSTVELPIKQLQVLPNITDSYMFGIPATIGTPPQNIVLLPWPDLNNTWIYDQNRYCDPTVIYSDIQCTVRRGNAYLESNSKSFASAVDIGFAGGSLHEASYVGTEFGTAKLPSNSIAGTDQFNLGGSGVLDKFPVGIPRAAWDGGYTTLHALGLGLNSTYLNALKSSGRIAKRVWSIYWGRMWTSNNPIDGSLIIGGYDQSKVVSGQNYTGRLDYSSYGTGGSGCWTGMLVNIADITVTLSTGTEKTIIPTPSSGSAASTIPMCIVPQRQTLADVPTGVYHQFEVVTGTSNLNRSWGFHWSGYIFPKDKVFQGDITFKFNTGFQVRVPNDQYVVPDAYFNTDGQRVINETGTQEVLINAVSATAPYTLGRYFLTSAVLMVDQDAGTFTIWQANPTASKKIVPMLDSKTALSCANNSTGGGNTDPSASPADSKQGVGLQAIIGIVVGVVVFLIIAAVVGLYLLRRRKARASVVVPPIGGLRPEYYRPEKPQELYGDQQVLQQVRYEADGKSIPLSYSTDKKYMSTHSSSTSGSVPGPVYEMDGTPWSPVKQGPATPLLGNRV